MVGAAAWIPLAEASRWRAALAGLDHGFLQLPEYSAATSRVHGHAAGLWHWRGPAGHAACPLSRRPAPGGGFDVATPLGFGGFALGGDLTGLAADWTDFWRGEGALAAYVQLSPRHDPAAWRVALRGLGQDLATSRLSCVWDLRPTPAALLSNMAQTHRNLLRQWARDGGEPCWDRAELQPAFDRLYADFVRRRGVGPAYRFTPDAMAGLADAPGALWVGARGADGEVEAVALHLWHHDWADTFLVAASEAGRRHSRALYWHAALRLRELGVERLNLGGGLRDGDPLEGFKQRLGAPPVPTLVLRQVFDATGFERACRLAGVRNASRFPPWFD